MSAPNTRPSTVTPQVYRLDLKSGKPLEANMRVTKPGRLAASANGALVATVDKHTLFVWKTHQAQMEPLALHHTKRFTVSAPPPTLSPSPHRIVAVRWQH